MIDYVIEMTFHVVGWLAWSHDRDHIHFSLAAPCHH